MSISLLYRYLYLRTYTLVFNHKAMRDGKKNLRNIFSSEFVGIDHEQIDDVSKKIFEKLFSSYNKINPAESSVIADQFWKGRIKLVQKSYSEIPIDAPILLCNVKDDLERIKMMLAHHRSLGIQHFAFLDNGSRDGTREYLLSEGVDLFETEEIYNSRKRAGWMMKLANYYGFSRWYVIVDSDELLCYSDCETKSINDVIKENIDKNIVRNPAFMLDMYPIENNFDSSKKENILEEYCYFDTDSYSIQKGIMEYVIYGGPRKRFFWDGEVGEVLTKYPIVFWKKGEIYRYHFVFPIEGNFPDTKLMVLKHYKFINSDYDKFIENVRVGNYAQGSLMYKKYLEKIDSGKKFTFMYSGSERYTKSSDLDKINII